MITYKETLKNKTLTEFKKEKDLIPILRNEKGEIIYIPKYHDDEPIIKNIKKRKKND